MKRILENAYVGAANAIGTVQTKDVSDITYRTNKTLNFFGKTTWADSQKIAIDNFLTCFANCSFKSKIKLLMIPCLIPETDSITSTMLNSSGSVYMKNLAGDEVVGDSSILSATYGYVKITSEGATFEAIEGETQVNINSRFRLNVESLDVTNKDFHLGVFYKCTDTYLSNQIGETRPGTFVSIGANTVLSNQAEISSIDKTTYNELSILNADSLASENKSYADGSIIDTKMIDTAIEQTITRVGLLQGGNSNDVEDSICKLVTFGESLTESELTQYADMLEYVIGELT